MAELSPTAYVLENLQNESVAWMEILEEWWGCFAQLSMLLMAQSTELCGENTDIENWVEKWCEREEFLDYFNQMISLTF